MLSLFPTLLNYSIFAPLILRVVLGLIFLDLGALKFRSEKKRWVDSFKALRLNPADFFVALYGALQIIGGVLLVVGFWTQGAALAFVIFTAVELYIEWTAKDVLKRDMVFYLLTFVISLSLLLTGPGAYSFDLPL